MIGSRCGGAGNDPSAMLVIPAGASATPLAPGYLHVHVLHTYCTYLHIYKPAQVHTYDPLPRYLTHLPLPIYY